jgi:tRNA dimethylallyltransferase
LETHDTSPMKIDAVLIAGPTASGKSAAALALADHIGGVVINADSMQVYAEAPILTAQPDANARAHAPHLLYGHVSAREAYSVGRYADDARRALVEAQAMKKIPIFVGGTGHRSAPRRAPCWSRVASRRCMRAWRNAIR